MGKLRRIIASDSLSAIHWVGAPTDHELPKNTIARQNLSLVTYHTMRDDRN